ncbi:flagellar basal body P-ring formation chaperone FlgA [Burkholderia sp. BE17]|uniref:flagellar basal body P-ring formation chaperone FlgA n=1 Tax=Burkholderia sp. BE17 TaxID=2656644 RepID=UPI00128D700B|nr:flagellar basal body P-ring formation chaperone FlgA [Burkholderia sp. BE17]MPV70250.1 flagellar basal body P-ring formation protein FlgA [Burkholderia sp. BE17]
MLPTDFSKQLIAHLALTVVAAGLAMPMAALAQAPVPTAARGGDPAAQQVKEAAQAWLARYVADHALTAPRTSVAVTPPRRIAPACDEPYDIVATDTKALTRMRFSVRCRGESRATVYLVKARIDTPMLVAATALAPGQTLGEADFRRDVRDFALTPDALTDPATAVGRMLRRAVKAGQVIHARMLKGVEAIRRGQAVQIEANTGPVHVSVPGTAMQNGAIDDVIRVKNASTGKVITARVTGTGTVEPVGTKK